MWTSITLTHATDLGDRVRRRATDRDHTEFAELIDLHASLSEVKNQHYTHLPLIGVTYHCLEPEGPPPRKGFKEQCC